jgi:hypothetical protein
VNAVVPQNGDLQLGAVRLPAGQQIPALDGGPLLWATATPVPDAGPTWLALRRLQGETGLVPFLLGFDDDQRSTTSGRPWDSGEVGNRYSLSEADTMDAAGVLEDSWANSLDPDEQDPGQLRMIAPFSLHFPGLAAGVAEPLTAAELSGALESLWPARIGMVPAARPADALARAGFEGGMNRYGSPSELVAVLRSWEDRFGAVLMEIGFAHYRVLVQRPPRTLAQAQPVAAEIWAVSDEFWPIERPGTSLTGVTEIAEYIIGAPFWALWLD